jgi:hypothetical protein
MSAASVFAANRKVTSRKSFVLLITEYHLVATNVKSSHQEQVLDLLVEVTMTQANVLDA